MQIVFLIWPVLLIPVLIVWLTRNDRKSSQPAQLHTSEKPSATIASAQKASSPPRACRQEAQRADKQVEATDTIEVSEVSEAAGSLTAKEQCNQSLFYRQAAVAAYEEMQKMQSMQDIQDMQDKISETVPASAIEPATSKPTSKPILNLKFTPKASANQLLGNASGNPLIRLG